MHPHAWLPRVSQSARTHAEPPPAKGGLGTTTASFTAKQREPVLVKTARAAKGAAAVEELPTGKLHAQAVDVLHSIQVEHLQAEVDTLRKELKEAKGGREVSGGACMQAAPQLA